MINGTAPGIFIYGDRGSSDSGLVRNIETKDDDYELTHSDYTILADGSSNTVAISLPTSPTDGQVFCIKSIDATFACTIDRNGKLIDGAANNLNLALNVSRTLQYSLSHGWVILC